MMNLVSITDARNNLSKLVSEVASKGQTYILVRDSLPQVVMVKYEDYVEKEVVERREWQREFDQLRREARKAFRKWADKRGIDVDKLTEEEMYELVDKMSGRN